MLALAGDLCRVQYQQSQYTYISVFGAECEGNHRPMVTHTCTTTAKITGRHMMAEAQHHSMQFQFYVYELEMTAKHQAGGRWSQKREGWVGLIYVYYFTTPVAPLFPH